MSQKPFEIQIHPNGDVTFVDLPIELVEIAEALNADDPVLKLIKALFTKDPVEKG
jgi:hypothetical protein